MTRASWCYSDAYGVDVEDMTFLDLFCASYEGEENDRESKQNGVFTAQQRVERSLNVKNPVDDMVTPTTLSTTSCASDGG